MKGILLFNILNLIIDITMVLNNYLKKKKRKKK